jgi:chloramphenicol 3-O-phosphotransferase
MSEQERMELAKAINETKEEQYITITESQFMRAMTEAAMKEAEDNNKLFVERDGKAPSAVFSMATTMISLSTARKAWDILTGKEKDNET